MMKLILGVLLTVLLLAADCSISTEPQIICVAGERTKITTYRDSLANIDSTVAEGCENTIDVEAPDLSAVVGMERPQ